MVDVETFRHLALSLPGTSESPHFEKTSFRIRKKIFSTLSIAERKACLKLSETDQSVFCSYDRSVIYPVPNKWGLQGWTFINLDHIPLTILKDALTLSWRLTAPKSLKV